MMNYQVKQFLDKDGLEQYHDLLMEVLKAQKITVDGKTIVIDDNNVISARVNYLPEINIATETLIFDASPSYVIQSTETLVYVSNT